MTSNHGAANSGQRLRVPLSEAFAMQQNSNRNEVTWFDKSFYQNSPNFDYNLSFSKMGPSPTKAEFKWDFIS